jgi:Tol biopolymer transport system component
VRLDRDYAPQGEPKELPAGDLDPVISNWTAGGDEILFSTGGFGVLGRMYRMPSDGASSPTLIDTGGDVGSFAVSGARRRLAYAVGTRNTNIWRLDLDKNAAPERLIASTRRQAFPQYSPDGRRIAFYSNRSGSYEIWLCDADGSKASAVTSMKRGNTGTPRWSPDGRTIAFNSDSSGTYQVYTVGADGGKVRQMTTGNGDNFTSSWSRDGRWMYFSANETGSPEQWKMAAQGGAPVPVTHNGGNAASESPDGKTLFYTKATGKGGQGSLWKMPVDGGPEEKIVDSVFRFNYAVTDKGVYVTRDGSIDFVDFATGAIRAILKTPRPDVGLEVSPDGRYLLFAQVDAIGSDLMLVENFR